MSNCPLIITRWQSLILTPSILISQNSKYLIVFNFTYHFLSYTKMSTEANLVYSLYSHCFFTGITTVMELCVSGLDLMRNLVFDKENKWNSWVKLIRKKKLFMASHLSCWSRSNFHWSSFRSADQKKRETLKVFHENPTFFIYRLRFDRRV